MVNRLHSLPFSHFCERARWALDHRGVEFEEVSWAAGVHTFLAKRLGCTSTSVPILETRDTVIQGSDKILDYCGIESGDREVEERFERRIGPLVRQYVYSGALSNRDSAIGKALFNSLETKQKLAGWLMWPMTKRAIASMWNCRPELLSTLEDDIEREFEWFEGRLRDKEYILERGFGRSDITAASLLSPLARPQQHPIYRLVKFPAAMEQKLTAWEERPSLIWVRRTYEQHRFPC